MTLHADYMCYAALHFVIIPHIFLAELRQASSA
jgi:hypothetical protein